MAYRGGCNKRRRLFGVSHADTLDESVTARGTRTRILMQTA